MTHRVGGGAVADPLRVGHPFVQIVHDVVQLRITDLRLDRGYQLTG
jgi:hypothetical protein